MKLRTARKILKAVVTDRQAGYTDSQVGRASKRFDRTKSAREDREFWFALMRFLGPSGRAELNVRWGNPGKAFELLMRSPESEWEGDDSFLVRNP